MKTIYIYCEGPTEESFINAVLYPYFLGMGIYVCPIVCETRRDANRKYRGGVSRYAKVKNELMILCKSHPHEYVTTMFDYYAMPSDTPGISDATPDILSELGKLNPSSMKISVSATADSISCFMNLKASCSLSRIHSI